ncbi:MAG: DNA polymerase III subunit alpha, partial [Deltaproteobacteria bacterium]|nr:DNA polymerase III subunit alpha [Deltaproteobacteria bacterium]
TVLPPDVNSSGLRWKGRKGFIRVGLQSIKGLSLKTQERIISGRGKGGYKNLEDFLSCVHPDEGEARALIHSGALDSLAPSQNHTHLLWKLARWQREKDRLARESQTESLFGGRDEELCPAFPPGSEIERLRRQFAVLGFLVDRHPIVLFADALPRKGLVKAADLKRHAGRRVRLAGWLITGKVVSTKQGDPMRFLTFEDETGLVETTFFPEAHRRFCHMLDWQRPYILSGKAEEDYGAMTLTVDQVSRVR